MIDGTNSNEHERLASSVEIKKADGRHVQFSLENNQTFEFEKMQSLDENSKDASENGLGKSEADEGSEEDLSQKRKNQREEIKKLNKQLHQFKQQCKKEMATTTENMEKKKQELEQELRRLEKKKEIILESNDVEGGDGDNADKHQQLMDKLKEKEKELAKKTKKILKYEKKIEDLVVSLADLKAAGSHDSSLNMGNSNTRSLELTDSQSQTADILVEYELRELKKNSEFLERQQIMLEKEQKLLEKEEELSKRQGALTEYENEIEEVEGYLNRRQAMVNRQQEDLMELDQELGLLRKELENEKSEMKKQGVDVDSSKEKAKLNWEFLRRGLVDKQSVAERQLRNCRANLAEAEVKLGTKDNDIVLLKKQIETMKHAAEKKDTKIKQLESHLEIVLNETKQLENGKTNGDTDSLYGAVRRSSLIGSNTRIPSSEFTVYAPPSQFANSNDASSSPLASPLHKYKFDDNDMRTIPESESSSSTGKNERLSRSYTGITVPSRQKGINRKRPTSLKSTREMQKHTSQSRRASSLGRRDPAVTFDYETPKSATCSVM